MSKVSHVRTIVVQKIILGDHVRLPGRFFGRLTASIQAEL
jgi:hypothetical protein